MADFYWRSRKLTRFTIKQIATLQLMNWRSFFPLWILLPYFSIRGCWRLLYGTVVAGRMIGLPGTPRTTMASLKWGNLESDYWWITKDTCGALVLSGYTIPNLTYPKGKNRFWHLKGKNMGWYKSIYRVQNYSIILEWGEGYFTLYRFIFTPLQGKCHLYLNQE